MTTAPAGGDGDDDEGAAAASVVPYAFFARVVKTEQYTNASTGEREVRTTEEEIDITDFASLRSFLKKYREHVSTEHTLSLTYRPLALFRVRPVTRCTDTLPGHTDAVLHVSYSPDGRHLLYTDLRSSENEWRKHAISEATRDIWAYDTKEKSHRRFTDWRGEDRDATWSADAKTVYWLSERSGSFNVWRQSIAGRAKPEQVTFHEKHPVRFLSISRGNDLVYGYDGEIWKLPHDAKEPVKIAVHISQGSLLDGPTFVDMKAQASEIAVSRDGTQLAVIARGEVFAVDPASGKTRRVTDTPQHERNLSFCTERKTQKV